MNDAQRDGRVAEILASGELAEYLAGVAHERAREHGDLMEHGETRSKRTRRVDDDDLARLATNAARSALDVWDPQYVATQRERGERGGRATAERHPCRPWARCAQPLDLLPLDRLSKAAQAQALGISISSVARLRRELRSMGLLESRNIGPRTSAGTPTNSAIDDAQVAETLAAMAEDLEVDWPGDLVRAWAKF